MHDHKEDDFSKSFMYAIHQTYFLVQKHLEHILLKRKSLSFSQFFILVGFTCSPNKPVSQSLIAERLHLTEATVSRHITTLVDLGFLSRSEDAANRRKHIILITKKGTQAFQAASKVIDKELESIFSSIPTKDRTNIIKNFYTIITTLRSTK